MADNSPVLIVLAGLPGVGKTTLAKALTAQLGAFYIRIDTIEQAMQRSMLAIETAEDAGYLAAYALAADNLRPGAVVIADSVNPIAITRDDWHAVGQKAGARMINVELICSDKAQHRARVEGRHADIPGHKLPSWQDVLDREYEDWDAERLVLDTAMKTTDYCAAMVIARVKDDA